MTDFKELREALRRHASTLRTNSMPLADLIPLLNKSADALDRLEAAERDAERYRFIRDADRSDRAISFEALLSLAMDSLDAAIDAAMKEQQP